MSNPAASKAKILSDLDKAIAAISPVQSQLSKNQGEIDKAWKMWKTDLHNTLTRKSVFKSGRKPRTLLSLIDKDFGKTYMKAWKAAPGVMRGIRTSSDSMSQILDELKRTRADVAAIQIPAGTTDAAQLLNLKASIDTAWGSADTTMRTAVDAIEVKAPQIGRDGLKLIRPAIKLLKMLLKKVNARIKKLSGRKLVIAKKKRLGAMKKAKKRITKFLNQAIIGEQKIQNMLEQLPKTSEDVREAHNEGSGFMSTVGSPVTPLPPPQPGFQGSFSKGPDIGAIMGMAILGKV